MPLTVSTQHVDFHFVFDTKTKHLVILFDEHYSDGRGRVHLRPYHVSGWIFIDHENRFRNTVGEVCDLVSEDFQKVKPYPPEIRYHLKTVIQKELFQNEL